ncbi:MAG: hypothetical protein CMQ15_10900 [Gammaproteobacteria bacterium]|nr:hypothetical protein [Gammaproteobacteria bacterium]
MKSLSLLLPLLVLLNSCSDNTPSQSIVGPAPSTSQAASETPAGADFSTERNAYFGDLHVHTMYSYDAFIFGTTSSPDDAYQFAKGGALTHPAGFEMQLDVPLDFYGVTDHAYYLGVLREMAIGDSEVARHEVAEGMDALGDDIAYRRRMFAKFRDFARSDRRMEIMDGVVVKTAWDDIVAAANRHNDPGNFTAFVGYEYTTSGSEYENLHRNVIFRGAEVPDMPFSKLNSVNPEDLWEWMDTNRAQGIESLAIPHNSNGSNGMMFQLTDFSGRPLDSSYANQRMRNEPLVEITQVKGASDTHPALSPNDEWSEFEIMPFRIGIRLPSQPQGSYVREAYLNGLEMEANQGFNPYKFGLIGSSDSHNSSAAGPEDDHWSKVALLDSDGQRRGSVPLDTPRDNGEIYQDTYYNYWGAAGLAGVWAEENTRESIYDAFRRKETFGTSGPRMKVRFFAGYNLPALDDSELVSKAYANGVPMGSDLLGDDGQNPSFLMWAAKDPNGTPLQRVQIIKGWVENGAAMEKVFDVACSDGAVVDPQTRRCPDNGARVNIADCSISAGVGAAELRASWQDLEFDPDQHAFYYVRALENPSCRWSTWDAIRAGVEPRPDMPSTLQERVWSSPIWITPN